MTAFVLQDTSCIVGRFSPRECFPSRLKNVGALLNQIYCFFVIKKCFCIELHSGERLRWFQCAEGPACLTIQQVTRSQKLLHGMIPHETFSLFFPSKLFPFQTFPFPTCMSHCTFLFFLVQISPSYCQPKMFTSRSDQDKMSKQFSQ